MKQKLELPKYHETFINILSVLEEEGVLRTSELVLKVFHKYYSQLPKDLLGMRQKDGSLVITNRIWWGVSYLKQGKFLEHPQRGTTKITEKGIKTFRSGKLTIEQLRKDDDFRKAETDKKEVKSTQNLKDLDSSSPDDAIQNGVSTIEQNTKEELLEYIKTIDPYFFEKVVLTLFEKMGYGDFAETSKSGDGGIDGIIYQDKLGLDKIYVQVKRYSDKKVHETDIRNFIGAMSGDTTKGLFVTTSEFDRSAEEKVKTAHHKIILINGDKLVGLMYKYGIGVQTYKTIEVKKVDNDFFEQT